MNLREGTRVHTTVAATDYFRKKKDSLSRRKPARYENEERARNMRDGSSYVRNVPLAITKK